MYKEKFVLSVLHSGSPLREFGPHYDKKVSMPFNSEYAIRLRNKNDRSCTARIFIDGTKLSSFGDIILQRNGYVDVERFINSSMNSGKKLKFVPLNHKDVNDPYSSDNGIIKVEFRLEKSARVVIDPHSPFQNDDLTPRHPRGPKRRGSATKGGPLRYSSSMSWGNVESSNMITQSMFNYVDTQDGATVEGGKSDQSFSYGDIDVNFKPSAVLKLKIVGVKGDKEVKKHTKFCTNCGTISRKLDRFCGRCGYKF